MKNIDTAFKQVRLVAVVVILASVQMSCYVIYKCFSVAMTAQDKVYVLANGKILEAFASDRKDNVPVEARDHIKTFHQYFFNLAPDEKVIQSNIAKALYLADESAKRQYDNLKESNYYANIISGNVSQEINIDSVQVNMDTYPIFFRCRATQVITRTTTIVHRSLVTEGYLRSVPRSDNNPHGFLIERWQILENRDLSVKNR
ncbi:conjugative transposon protein TraK [Olivibacter jilunii]|uniref:conjugative transposon protein TraK n=1 Tax=Olivibacter jilunii TaxID=985016 RepID=UPI0030FE8D15